MKHPLNLGPGWIILNFVFLEQTINLTKELITSYQKSKIVTSITSYQIKNLKLLVTNGLVRLSMANVLS